MCQLSRFFRDSLKLASLSGILDEFCVMVSLTYFFLRRAERKIWHFNIHSLNENYEHGSQQEWKKNNFFFCFQSWTPPFLVLFFFFFIQGRKKKKGEKWILKNGLKKLMHSSCTHRTFSYLWLRDKPESGYFSSFDDNEIITVEIIVMKSTFSN